MKSKDSSCSHCPHSLSKYSNCDRVIIGIEFLDFLFLLFFFKFHSSGTQALSRPPKTCLEKLWGKVKALF